MVVCSDTEVEQAESRKAVLVEGSSIIFEDAADEFSSVGHVAKEFER